MEVLSESLRNVVRDGELLGSWARARLAILGWLHDGTLIFATADDHANGVDWQQGLATPFQHQFADSPQLVAAIERAYQGQPGSETVRLKDSHWDVRLWPTFQEGRLSGVVGILTDAGDRITAHRSVKTLELLANIRYRLARSDSPEEFLANCCKTIEAIHPAVWIGIADRGEGRPLRVITGVGNESKWFAPLDISWDVANKNGRHPPAQAVRTGRVQIERNVKAFNEGDAWIDADLPWNGLLALPLLGNGASLGVLVVHGDEESGYDSEMIRLWEQIAGEITEGIELLRAKEERARIARERQGAYQQYQQLLNTIFDIVVVHRAGRVIEINPAGVKLLGVAKAEEIVGTQVLTLIDPMDRELMREILRESSGIDELREFRVLSLDGRSIDVEGLTVSVSHDGQPARLSHWRDISERKRAEKLIVQQKTSLEYAQQVAQSGSVDLDVVSGLAEWSRNALTILGLGADMQGRSFVEAISSVVADQDRIEVARFVDNICQQAKESNCEVTLKSEDPGEARVIHIHGIPQIEQHTRVLRIFVVVQDISRYRSAERYLKAKLQATWRLAKVAEWTYELENQVIVFHGVQKDFLGYESPVTSITYDQFIGSIREQDREEVNRAVAQTVRHGSVGEVVYEEKFHQGVRKLLYTRWVPERGEDGGIVRFRGLSLDISRARDIQERDVRKERIHSSGLPEKEMVYDRLYYLASRAVRLALPFSVIGLRITNYRQIKREMAKDALYRQTHNDIARAIFETMSHVDTFGRLSPGRFLLILSAPASTGDAQQAAQILASRWQSALKQCDSPLESSIDVATSVAHCPQDCTEWEGLLTLLEQQLGRDDM